MNTRVIAALLGAAGWTLAASAVAETPPDPWQQIVPLPTACYSSQDQFDAQSSEAIGVLSAENERLTEGNQQVQQSIQEVDPMELARRMQENMMKDPEHAAQYMQSVQATGNAMQTELPEEIAKDQQFQADEKALLTRYKAALDKANTPANARWVALKKKLGVPLEYPSIGEYAPPWAWQEFRAIQHAWDSSYVATCPAWWGTAGEAHAFLKRYKDYLISEKIPRQERNDAQGAAGMQMMGTDSTGHQSTAKVEAVEDYVKLAQRLFGNRDLEPNCSGEKCRW